jgi:Acetyltransferases
MKLEYIRAKKENLDSILVMFKNAVSEMVNNAIDQWDELYPDRSILEEDIIKEQLYIGISEGNLVSAYVLNQEYDEQYANGKWEYPSSTFCVIHRLCVNPLFQKKGVGTQMMQHIESEVKKMRIDSIRLDAFTLNPYAVKMYEGLGYKIVGLAHWRKGEFYLMEKKIV